MMIGFMGMMMVYSWVGGIYMKIVVMLIVMMLVIKMMVIIVWFG